MTESGGSIDRHRVLLYALVCILAAAVVAGGYQLYRMSVTQAVNGTTTSFMSQIAAHDAQAIYNQMASKWEYLESLSDRIRLTRQTDLEDISYLLSVEMQASSFDSIFLVSSDGKLYDNTYLISSLDDRAWADAYKEASARFALRYTLEEREVWGEYLVYGTKLSSPLSIDDTQIEGIVGLVPIADIESNMRFESFDGQGLAIVIQPSGDVVTASKYYGGADGQNYFSELGESTFSVGSLEECLAGIARNEDVNLEYQYGKERYYATMTTIPGSDWYLVVKVKAAVTANQVDELMSRSLIFFGILAVVLAGVLFVIFRSVRNERIARESDRAKSTFLANMSHEIRTPLNGIVGLQYLMRQNLDDPEKLTQYLDQADVSAEFLKSVITDVLDMSKIESGQMDLRAAPFSLPSMLSDIETLLSSQARSVRIAFSIDYEPLAAPSVVGDEMRLKQAIINLLGNALKFTDEGGKVSLAVSQETDKNIAITTFVIADTGCGMSADFLERIWEPFEQERRVTSQSGTGLGTALSKTLVEAMGGTIEVESTLGVGTTFTISVPLPVSGETLAESTQTTAQEATLSAKRVLVAEDNDVNRMIIVDILNDEGCEVVEAVDGQAAVDAFAVSEPGYFDVVLLDLQMPILDGFGAAKAIRGLHRPDGATVFIMALTANALRDDVERAKRCGMNDVVTKPLNVAQLLEKLRTYDAADFGQSKRKEN